MTFGNGAARNVRAEGDMNGLPQEVIECLNSTLGSGAVERMRSGTDQPTAAIDAAVQACLSQFGMGGPGGGGMMPGSENGGTPNQYPTMMLECAYELLPPGEVEEFKMETGELDRDIIEKLRPCLEERTSSGFAPGQPGTATSVIDLHGDAPSFQFRQREPMFAPGTMAPPAQGMGIEGQGPGDYTPPGGFGDQPGEYYVAPEGPEGGMPQAPMLAPGTQMTPGDLYVPPVEVEPAPPSSFAPDRYFAALLGTFIPLVGF